MNQANQIGQKAEELAARYLEYKGYQILERRYRSRLGEIDLIACKQQVLVFVEVKYRSSLSAGRPAVAVGKAKQRKICRTALYYLRQSRQTDRACRFDVVELWQQEGRWKVHHYHHAFEGESNGI